MNKKIVFFDIDGTLVNNEKEISFRVIKAIQKLRSNGHLAILCTGRSCNYLSSILQIGFDGYICCGGAYIVFQDNVVYCKYLAPSLACNLRKTFNTHEILYDHECIGVDYIDDEMIESIFYDPDIKRKQKNIARFKKENKTAPIHQYQGEPILKISYLAKDTQQLTKAAQELKNEIKITVNPSFSNTHICGDVIPKHVNKGTAILKLLEYIGLDIKDTIAFGDSMNDMEMLQTCHDSIVMGNSSDDIRTYATSICESVSNDGVYQELLRKHLI